MTFPVRELRRAKADKRRMFEWLHERSRPGAVAWLAAYDRMIERLKSNADSFAEAFENADLEMEVKEVLFKTRRGRVYRALFVIESDDVFILRVRGPGQGAVDAGEIDTP
jgi:plasmid stabilization system protein ParE